MRLASFLVAAAVFTAPTLSASAQAGSPSFNCAKAKSLAEKAICADGQLTEADAAIAAAYIKAGKALDSYTGEDLDKDQKYFIGTRDEIAERAHSQADRIKQLRAHLAARVEFLSRIETSPGKGLTGEWRNVSGAVTIEQGSDGNLKASVNTVDPADGRWVCQADGSGKTSDRDNVLEFKVDEESLTLTRAGTQPVLGIDVTGFGGRLGPEKFCGMNGTVKGWYFKMKTKG